MLDAFERLLPRHRTSGWCWWAGGVDGDRLVARLRATRAGPAPPGSGVHDEELSGSTSAFCASPSKNEGLGVSARGPRGQATSLDGGANPGGRRRSGLFGPDGLDGLVRLVPPQGPQHRAASGPRRARTPRGRRHCRGRRWSWSRGATGRPVVCRSSARADRTRHHEPSRRRCTSPAGSTAHRPGLGPTHPPQGHRGRRRRRHGARFLPGPGCGWMRRSPPTSRPADQRDPRALRQDRHPPCSRTHPPWASIGRPTGGCVLPGVCSMLSLPLTYLPVGASRPARAESQKRRTV